MHTIDDIEASGLLVHKLNTEVMHRNALPVWTIYDRPRDYPEYVVARLHESCKGGVEATSHVLIHELATLRTVFGLAGLVHIDRQPEDDPVIVESWL